MATVAEKNVTLRSHFGPDRHPVLGLATLYFALFNGDPVSSGVEPTSAGAYARIAKVNDSTLFPAIAASAVSVTNTGSAGEIRWPALTALWSQPKLTHWAVFDNSAGGTLYYSGKLTSDIVPTGVGDVPRIPAGSLTVSGTG